MPARRRASLRDTPLARTGGELRQILDFVRQEIAPFPTRNGHPASFA
ncbi:hypothetical protein [Streptomyces sp. NPDC086023]